MMRGSIINQVLCLLLGSLQLALAFTNGTTTLVLGARGNEASPKRIDNGRHLFAVTNQLHVEAERLGIYPACSASLDGTSSARTGGAEHAG